MPMDTRNATACARIDRYRNRALALLNLRDDLDMSDTEEFQAGAFQCLTDLLGPDANLTKRFTSAEDFHLRYQLERQLGVLSAVREEIEHGGLLVGTRALIAAEIFDDLLEQANHLADEGYWQAAVAIAGSVLESSLRAFGVRHNVGVKDRDDLNTLNQKLGAAKLFNSLRLKKVAHWIDLRNHVDHGKFEGVDERDAVAFVTGLRDFLDTLN